MHSTRSVRNVAASLAFATAAVFATPHFAAADTFQPSNSVVLFRLGNSGTPLSAANANSVPAYLDEYNLSSGSLIQSVPLSGNAAVPNEPVDTAGGFSYTNGLNRDGIIQRSSDGRYIAVGGYNVPVGTANPLLQSKIITRVGASGVPDYSTKFNDVGVNSAFRAVSTDDGSRYWFATDGSNSIGYIPQGGSSATAIQTGAWRTVHVANGQLYAGSGSSGQRGISTVGTGLPTNAGQPFSTLTPAPNPASGPGVASFVFADANTIYAAGSALATDAGSNAVDDFREYRFEGGSWVLKSFIASPEGASSAYGVLALPAAGGQFTLLLSTNAGVYKVTDDPTDSTFPTLGSKFITAAADTAFRGLAQSPVPEPGSIGLLAIGGAVAALRRRRRR